MKTVAELYSDIRGQAGTAGVCDVADLMRRMNIIGPELLDEIDAKGTLWTWCVPVSGGCVIMPPDVQQVLSVAVCGRAVAQRSESWLGRMGGSEWGDGWSELPWSNMVELNRTSATQFAVEPVGINERFAIQAKSQQDAGVEMEIRWRTRTTGQEYIVHPTLQGAQVLKEIDGPPGELTRLWKPRTKGAVLLWLKDISNGNTRIISYYDPRMELPEYKVMQLTGCRPCASMTLRGKKKWVELRDESDVVPFGRVMAWRNALMAESASVEGKLQERGQYMAAAIQDLEREKRGSESPNNQRSIQILSPWSVGAGSSSIGPRGFTRRRFV